MPRPLRVFLCHASQDKPAVRELYLRLKAEGWIDPWLDEEKLSFGQHWTTVIEGALADADVVIIFLSKNSVRKEGFVQRELNHAWELSLEKPRDVIFLIPFRLDDCQVPRYLGSRQWGDYFGNKKDTTYQILLRSLKQRHQQKLHMEAEEKVAREKEERDQAERETAARLARVKEERDAAEKAERETALLLAREKEARDATRAARENSGQQSSLKPVQAVERKKQPAPTPSLRALGIGGVIIVCLFITVFGGNYLVNSINSAAIDFPVTVTKTFKPISPTVTSNPRFGSDMISEKDGMTLVFVWGGRFRMGSNNGFDDEKPEHQVFLDAFWIDKTEVTNKMYAMCVNAGGCEPPSSTNRFSDPTYADHPVVYVDWNQANVYCSWARRRLPSEAEWEIAALNGDKRTYPWGDEIDCDKANYVNCVGGTTQVGSYLDGVGLNGVYDMAGNVWEWVSSLYKLYPYDENDGREDLTDSGLRVIRGGSWFSSVNYIRSTFRGKKDPALTSDLVGFRCSLSP